MNLKKHSAYWTRLFAVFLILTIIEAALVTVDTVVFTVKYYTAYPHVEATVVSETALGDHDSYSYVLSYMYHNEELRGTIIRDNRITDTTLDVAIDPEDPTYVLDTPGNQMLRIVIVLFIAAIGDLIWYVERDAEKNRLVSLTKPCIGTHIVNLAIAVIMVVFNH